MTIGPDMGPRGEPAPAQSRFDIKDVLVILGAVLVGIGLGTFHIGLGLVWAGIFLLWVVRYG